MRDNTKFKKFTVNTDDNRLQPQMNSDLLHLLPDEIIRWGISTWASNAVLARLSKSSVCLFSICNDGLTTRAMQALLQAVIDDDREKVKKILDSRPDLLVLEPAEKFVSEVKSQLTWQIFEAEKPLVMALKRNQVKMVEILLSYFEKLEDGAQKALEQWENAEKALKNRNRSVDFSSLIEVIAQEDFSNDKLRKNTEKKLGEFRKTVLPDEAIALDDYFDIEQLLITAYKAFDEGFYVFQNKDQRNVFCINVIGFIQSLLSPEYAKVFCQGLWHVIDDGEEISDRAARLRLLGGGKSFYRDDRQAEVGLGFKYLCSALGACWAFLTCFPEAV